MNFCPMCGERCMKGAAFCMNCGMKLSLDPDSLADVSKANHISPSYDAAPPPALPQKSKKRKGFEITKFIYNILLVIYAGLSYLSVVLAWISVHIGSSYSDSYDKHSHGVSDYFYLDYDAINCAFAAAILLFIVGTINFIQGLKIKNDIGTRLSCIFRFVAAILIMILAIIAGVEQGF